VLFECEPAEIVHQAEVVLFAKSFLDTLFADNFAFGENWSFHPAVYIIRVELDSTDFSTPTAGFTLRQ
jgi:hypothetical protein